MILLTQRNKQKQSNNNNSLKETEQDFSLKKQKVSYKNNLLISLLFLVRFVSAVFVIILNDCDEVYNYYEPLHYLQFKKGKQTWEYSPSFSLRSYFYLLIHLFCPSFISFPIKNKILKFILTRFFLSFFTFLSEYFLFKKIQKKISSKISVYFLLFSLLNTGLFVSASVSFLPSSFCMVLLNFSFGFYLCDEFVCSVLCCCFGCLVWPFSVVAYLPVLVSIALKSIQFKSFFKVVLTSLSYSILLLLVFIVTDTFFYRKLTFSTLNILLYNVSSKNSNSELYGTEAWYYYLQNLFLNFNFLLNVWVICPFLLAYLHLFRFYEISSLNVVFLASSVKHKHKDSNDTSDNSHHNNHVVQNDHGSNFSLKLSKIFDCLNSPFAQLYIQISTSYITTLFFTLISEHKEERFLYVIYPMILYSCSICFNFIKYKLVRVSILAVYGLFSLFRVYSLFICYFGFIFVYYDFYTSLSNSSSNSSHKNTFSSKVLCLGEEWHRFPSHYFVPDNVRLEFIKSSFTGHLPRNFVNKNDRNDFFWEREGTYENVTWFNNENKEDPSVYVVITNYV